MKNRGWYVLGLLFLVSLLNYLDRSMIFTIRSSIVASISMTDAQFGLLTSGFSLVYGIFCPIAGFIADRFKKSYLIIGSLFVWSLVTLLTGYVTTYEQLLAARALMGISEAFFLPAALSMIMDSHKKPSLAIGILFSGEMIGMSLGFLGGRIAESHSWNEAFRLFGLVGIVYAVFLIFTLKEIVTIPAEAKKQEEPKAPKIPVITTLKSLFGKWSFFYLLLIYALPSIAGWMVMGWLPTYYQEQFHFTEAVAGEYATAYLYPSYIIGFLLGGFLSDKWQKTYPYARIVLPIIGFCIAAPCVFMIGYTFLLWQVVVVLLAYGITKTLIDTNLMPILCMVIDKRHQATGFGVINMFAVFAGGLSVYIAGALRDAHVSLSTVFQYASLGLMLCVVLLFLVKREVKKSEIKK